MQIIMVIKDRRVRSRKNNSRGAHWIPAGPGRAKNHVKFTIMLGQSYMFCSRSIVGF